MNSELTPKGEIEIIIEYSNGKKETRMIENAVLRTGRSALAASLANSFDEFDFYIHRMLFGDGGTDLSGAPKYVNYSRNGLFGITRANNPVISRIDPESPWQVIFTSVLKYEDANGYSINELALQMYNGDLYSMSTFGGFVKTSIMQLTFNWRVYFT